MHCTKAHIWDTRECSKCKAKYLENMIYNIKKHAELMGYEDIVVMTNNIDKERYLIKN